MHQDFWHLFLPSRLHYSKYLASRISHLASRISHLASRISHLASRISHLASRIFHPQKRAPKCPYHFLKLTAHYYCQIAVKESIKPLVAP
ncbi:hypothetical protein F7Q91_11000 [Vibrio chagasii]|uniref:Uncharacterized protein n=1 Tax=Vibrio chagasii TaxID=170679 RepID=A0A7V7TGN3_9VIBR|nr:hypothetical protein F7Q91_11000 [Vibrio chagasii]